MKFQSYLTGIEMSTYQSVQQHRQGSNRTLLELKYEHAIEIRLHDMFQSNLTGIEMKNKDGKNQ